MNKNVYEIPQDQPVPHYYQRLKTIDELLERDKMRQKDGFPPKIRLGRIIKPGKGGGKKIIVIPTTIEEKFYHDKIPVKSKHSPSDSNGDSMQNDVMGGTGKGKEGDVIGEVPIHQEGGEKGAGGSGQGEGEGHDMGSNAYDIGKILTEKFKLPNLKDKGKKKIFTKFTYDLTDKNRGFGQLLDKKATLKRIITTNKSLGRLNDLKKIDTSTFVVDPNDKVYRILSQEKEYESQALVFFLRDYSASMSGKPTQLCTSQHLLIYSWLMFQYKNQVEARFILHDTSARQVPDFYTYYNLSIAGGTNIFSGYKLINELIEKHNLARDYNIYIFHGTDGDDSDSTGVNTLKEITKLLPLVNRIGITLISSRSYETTFEKYLLSSNQYVKNPKLIRMSKIGEDADEQKVIDGIRLLVEEK